MIDLQVMFEIHYLHNRANKQDADLIREVQEALAFENFKTRKKNTPENEP